MKLYHGSLEIADNPQIVLPSRTLDYGSGFYTTTSHEQALRWVMRKKREIISVRYVNIYESFYDSEELNVLLFKEPTLEWVDFVLQNRMVEKYSHSYDIVFGPVANDRVYAAFALFENGLLDKEGLIRELKAYTLVDQILFHTEKALKYLSFLEAEEVKL